VVCNPLLQAGCERPILFSLSTSLISYAACCGTLKSEDLPALEKTPDRRVREAIELLFDKVVEIGSVARPCCDFRSMTFSFPPKTPRARFCGRDHAMAAFIAS
jgi:hypothetical protein